MFEASESRGAVRRPALVLRPCETITPRNIERVKALGGGIAIQHRMAYQGEYFVDRYGAKAAEAHAADPPHARAGRPRRRRHRRHARGQLQPVGRALLARHRQDRRRSSPDERTARLDRTTALRLYTEGSAWFSSENGKKGRIAAGQLADLVALGEDYFSVPEEEIKSRLGAHHRRRPDRPRRSGVRGSRAAVAAGLARLVAGAQLWRLPPNSCGDHRHAMLGASARTRFVVTRVPVRPEDASGFWGALGCGCFAF